MDCRTTQTAPGLTLTGWRSNRPPAFFCFDGSGIAGTNCPRAETRRLSRSPPPLVSETRRDSACPSGAPSGAFFRRRSAALLGLAAFPQPCALRGRPVQTLRSAHGAQKLPSEPTQARCARQAQIRSARAGWGCPDSWSQSVRFQVLSVSVFCLSPSPARFRRGQKPVVPSEDYSHRAALMSGLLMGEGRETEAEQRIKKRP